MTRDRQWRFSFWPVLGFICVLPALLWLGTWQVQRGIEKAETYEAFERGAERDAQDVTGMSLGDFNALPRYERVALRGRYLVDRQFLLDNMSHEGRPGHHVFTPFLPEGSSYAVIVDRGWQAGLARNRPSKPAAPEDARTVTGMLAPLPQPALRLKGKPEFEGWPSVVQFPDSGELATALKRPVAEPRLLLDANAEHGFVREWSAPGIPPARHYAYAFQWFGLAIALIVIFILLARPRRKKDPEE